MKHLAHLILALTIISSSVFAKPKTVDACLDSYDGAFLKLATATRLFNKRYMTPEVFAGKIGLISTDISIVRTVCAFIQDEKVEKCVEVLRDRYRALRDEISIADIAMRKQTEVESSVLDNLEDKSSDSKTPSACELINYDYL